ncbi:MAG: sigma-70 family RNA polymerase sigma factor [Planctomycetota bacterium]
MTTVPKERVRLPDATQRPGRQPFEQLVLLHQDRIYNLAYRMLNDPERARDVTQEAFIQAFQRLPTFRGESSFYTWLYRITLNLCRAEYRRDRARRKPTFLSLFDLGSSRSAKDDQRATELSCDGAGPFESVEGAERRDVVRRVVAGLDDDLKQVTVLREMEGMSYEEVAATLDIPIGTVRSRLHRARQVLRERLRQRLEAGE